MSAIRRDVGLAGFVNALMMISSFAAHFYPRCPPGEPGKNNSAERQKGKRAREGGELVEMMVTLKGSLDLSLSA